MGRARTTGLEAEASLKQRTGTLEGLGLTAAATLLRATNLVEGPNTYGNDLPFSLRVRRAILRISTC